MPDPIAPLSFEQQRIWWELINASSFLTDSEKRHILEKLLGVTLDELVRRVPKAESP